MLPTGRLLWPMYVHLLVLGWLTQLIFGVAYWMFPRPSAAARQRERLGWPSYWLFNAGLLLRVVSEWGRAAGNRTDGMFVAAGLFQLLAGWSFVLLIWPRIKGR